MKVLKFYAEWCGPCRTLTSDLDRVQNRLNLPIEEVDIDTNTELAVSMNIRSVPTLVVVDDNNRPLRQRVGAGAIEEVIEFINL